MIRAAIAEIHEEKYLKKVTKRLGFERKNAYL
jgi:hypothetical protein